MTISLINIKALLLPCHKYSYLSLMKSEHWTQAMREEMDALERNST